MSNQVKYLIATGGFSFISIAITMADFLSSQWKAFIIAVLFIATVSIINKK